jgi:hypothetical protein
MVCRTFQWIENGPKETSMHNVMKKKVFLDICATNTQFETRIAKKNGQRNETN